MSFLFIELQDAIQKSDSSPIPYLAAAYAGIFILLFAFMLLLQRRQSRNKADMRQLQTRLDEVTRERARISGQSEPAPTNTLLG